MTQCKGIRRVRAWSTALALLLATGALASCGGSSKSPRAGNASASASATSPSSPSAGTTTAPSSPASPNGNGTGGTSTTAKPEKAAASAPITRASRFVTCMRAHGIKLPAATRSPGGSATLDFKGIDTRSSRYKTAVATCARELLTNLKTGTLKGHAVPLKGIQVHGIRLAKVRVGHINLPAIHVPSVHLGGNLNLPNIHVTTPAPNLGGQGNGAEPPTSTQGATG